MPIISVNKDNLFKVLNQTYTDEEFSALCFDYGLELDEVTSEKKLASRERGDEKAANESEETIFKIEIPANRYDLLCLIGLARALLIFQGKCSIPFYKAINPNIRQKIFVKTSVKDIRPYIVGAILRNINFDNDSYNSFIDLQDKLHQNLCRKRSLVAIGTHDLDKINGPFIYTTEIPKDLKFVPLNESHEFSADELIKHYSINSHLKSYLPIIMDKPRYPVIYDYKGIVLSMPPIINGDHSKITLNTRNVFIECTATDLNKANIVIDTLVCMFSEYCDKKLETETIEVIYEENGMTFIYPELKYREETVSLRYVNKLLGLKKNPKEIVKLIARMGLKSKLTNDGNLKVTIPPTRHDILHPCDVVEDIAISYGYSNFEITVPNVVTIGEQLDLSKYSDQLRYEISRCGYTEALTFSLLSKSDLTDKMRNIDGLMKAVHISNPKTAEFQVARVSLIPGLLKTLEANKTLPLPIKIFEISDVLIKDSTTDVGCINRRYITALYYNKASGFEFIHGLMDRIMQVLEIEYLPDSKIDGYHIEAVDDPRFLPGRSASIIFKGSIVGVMGILHPEVINNFGLCNACSVMELDLQKIKS